MSKQNIIIVFILSLHLIPLIVVVKCYADDGVLPINVDWNKDLDVVILAGCSVLDVDDKNDNFSSDVDQHNASPGRLWALTGPDIFLGYNYSAPLDNQNGDPQFTANIIEKVFERRFSQGETWAHAWGYAHKDMADELDLTNPFNSCAIEISGTTRTYWYWKSEWGGTSYTWESMDF